MAIQEPQTKAFKRLLKAIDNDGKEDGLLKDDLVMHERCVLPATYIRITETI